MKMKSMHMVGIFVGAIAFSSHANAVVIDFTTNGWTGGLSNTNVIAGIGNVTVTSVNGGNLNADGVSGTPPCAGLFNLACQKDGVGIGDDEITFGAIGGGELLRVTFDDTAVNVVDIGFLDLFTQPSEDQETASWTSDGGGPYAAGSAMGTDVQPGSGWLLVSALGITGVTSIDFFAGSPSNSNSDFALAYLNVMAAPPMLPPPAVPLPAALPLFGTGLAVMGFLGWRRKRQAQAVA